MALLIGISTAISGFRLARLEHGKFENKRTWRNVIIKVERCHNVIFMTKWEVSISCFVMCMMSALLLSPQDSCASPVSRDGLGGASSSQGLDSGGVSDGAQADGGRSTSPLPSTPGQASHSPTPSHSLQHGACLSLSDVSSIVSVQEEVTA